MVVGGNDGKIKNISMKVVNGSSVTMSFLDPLSGYGGQNEYHEMSILSGILLGSSVVRFMIHYVI